MEQVLEEIASLRTLVIINLVATTILFLYLVFRTAIGNLARVDTLRREQFLSLAQAHDDQGKYTELIELAEERISKYPKDAMALWFLSIGQYKAKQYGAALSSFGKLKTLDPATYQDLADEYISDIKSAMSGPKS